jgi:hypothetical protein
MAIIKIRNTAIDLDAAEIPNISASKITSGTMDAARIGSGTFADARIASSNVSQHATSFDDNKIVNDISTIALRQATNENAIAYNTNSSFVDVFQDSSGIASFTASIRDANEYISTVSGSQYVRQNITALTSSGGNIGGDLNITKTRDAVEGSTTDVNSYNAFAYTTNSSVSGYVIADLGASYSISQLIIGKNRGHGDARSIKMRYHATQTDPQANGTDINFTNATSTIYSYKGSSASSSNLSNFSSSGTADWTDIGTNADGVVCKVNGFTPFTARYISYKFGSADFHDNNAGWSEFDIYKNTISANATGNFISNTITAPSSVSSMGAIITYQDQTGTNALNTDIVLQLSADSGSNYSTATLTALPDFSTGIKMAKVNDLAVTAGTQLKYKLNFANQASGSKEARIRGVSLQY